ncbi:MAG: hypothetical protein QGI86_06945 [Candidatus Poribacteria bacterium]|nr:hypothetical protein [Candidatus Poribacteria bacterium]MDP6748765.1 hypothetical protein [Candidatus Poribacteria bacterium]
MKARVRLIEDEMLSDFAGGKEEKPSLNLRSPQRSNLADVIF